MELRRTMIMVVMAVSLNWNRSARLQIHYFHNFIQIGEDKMQQNAHSKRYDNYLAYVWSWFSYGSYIDYCDNSVTDSTIALLILLWPNRVHTNILRCKCSSFGVL